MKDVKVIGYEKAAAELIRDFVIVEAVYSSLTDNQKKVLEFIIEEKNGERL